MEPTLEQMGRLLVEIGHYRVTSRLGLLEGASRATGTVAVIDVFRASPRLRLHDSLGAGPLWSAADKRNTGFDIWTGANQPPFLRPALYITNSRKHAGVHMIEQMAMEGPEPLSAEPRASAAE